MIVQQGGTANTPNSAIPAAIAEDTTLLLGIWCSGGQDVVTNEIAAIKAAIEQYGEEFTSRVTGLSVGSEDLYRISPTGIAANSGFGANPDELVNYINQAREALKGTALENVQIGHVDTWNDWVNGSNSAVVQAVDWLGFDGYPYFQSTVENSIENAEALFDESYAATVAAAQGKDVWVTESGWPVSGPTYGDAVASIENARKYWEAVACKLIGNVNTYWYTLQDAYPTTPSPSFGVVGTELSNTPLYDLSCPADGESSSSSSAASSSAATSSGGGSVIATGSVTATGIEGSAPTNTNGTGSTVGGSIIYVPSVTRIVSLDASTSVASPTAPNPASYPPAGTGASGTGRPGFGQGGNAGAAPTGGSGSGNGSGAVGTGGAGSGSEIVVPTGGPGGGSIGGGGAYNGGNGTDGNGAAGGAAGTGVAGGAAGTGVAGGAAGTGVAGGAAGTGAPIAPTSSQFMGGAVATAAPIMAGAAAGLMAVMAAF